MYKSLSNHEEAKISSIMLSTVDNAMQSMACILKVLVPRKKVNMEWNRLTPLSLLELLQFGLGKAHCYLILIDRKS